MIPSFIHAYHIDRSGTAPVLRLQPQKVSGITEDDVLIKVAAIGLNRADLFQLQGTYPAPDGMADVPGLEISGHVVAVGGNVSRWHSDDAVCALLAGGGYADYVVVKANHCLPVPKSMSIIDAAALPECIATVWMTMVWEAGVKAGERVLVHGGASGIGTTAIQILKLLGAKVIVTASSDERCLACEQLGATAINYRTQDFVEVVKKMGGVDVVLDMIGGDTIAKNMRVLCTGGRMISIAFLDGSTINVPAGSLLMKRLTWRGSTLRSRSDTEKAELLADIEQKVWPWVASGAFKPVIDSVYPFDQATQALEKMEKRLHLGKILLQLPASPINYRKEMV